MSRDSQRHCDLVSCLIGNTSKTARYFMTMKYKHCRSGQGDTTLEVHLSLADLLQIRSQIDQAMHRELKALGVAYRDGSEFSAALASVSQTERECAVREAEALLHQEHERNQELLRLAGATTIEL